MAPQYAPADSWVQLRERRSWGDVVEIQDAGERSMRGIPGAFTLFRTLQIQKCVESWSFEADLDDPRSWGELSEHVLREIVRGIDAYYGEQMERIEERRKQHGTG